MIRNFTVILSRQIFSILIYQLNLYTNRHFICQQKGTDMAQKPEKVARFCNLHRKFHML